MISEKDLQEAIAECQGVRNPNASTCIKLAAFYTILNNLYPKEIQEEHYIAPYDNYVPQIQTESEFMNVCSRKDILDVLEVLNEHMEAIKLLYPKEYDSIIEKIKNL